MAYVLDELPTCDPWIHSEFRRFQALVHRVNEGDNAAALVEMGPTMEKIKSMMGPSPVADWADDALKVIAETMKPRAAAADPVRMTTASQSPRVKLGKK